MSPASMTAMPMKPQSGLAPPRKAADPPAEPTSPRACPAKAWPRMTVKTPTAPVTSATTAPTTRAACTGPLAKNPGANSVCNSWFISARRCRARPPHRRSPPRGAVAGPARRTVGLLHGDPGRALRPRHHQDATVDAEHVDVLTVEGAQHLGPDHLGGGPARSPARGDINEPVHHREQGID